MMVLKSSQKNLGIKQKRLDIKAVDRWPFRPPIIRAIKLPKWEIQYNDENVNREAWTQLINDKLGKEFRVVNKEGPNWLICFQKTVENLEKLATFAKETGLPIVRKDIIESE